MVACTLDYYWARYVIAALVSLFGGVVILLPIRLIRQALEGKRRRRRQTPATRVRSTLDFLRTGAEGIVAGNSTVNKIIVSLVHRLSLIIIIIIIIIIITIMQSSSLSRDFAKTLVQAFISSRLDYSNSVLYGVTDRTQPPG